MAVVVFVFMCFFVAVGILVSGIMMTQSEEKAKREAWGQLVSDERERRFDAAHNRPSSPDSDADEADRREIYDGGGW